MKIVRLLAPFFLVAGLLYPQQTSRMIERVLAHIRKQGYYIVDSPPDDATRMKYPKIAMVKQRMRAGGGGDAGAGGAWRTEPDSPEGVRVIASMRKGWGAEPVSIRTMGGSVPAALFIRGLNVPVIGLPTVNFDNNQHSDNENLRLGNLWSGDNVSITAPSRVTAEQTDTKPVVGPCWYSAFLLE